MIANIDGDAGLRVGVRLFPHPPQHQESAGFFPDGFAAGDATFGRLRKDIAPTEVWVRNGSDCYERREPSSLRLESGTLCQIGVHLAPGGSQTRGRFCQIVSGTLRGVRFLFQPGDFEASEQPPARRRVASDRAVRSVSREPAVADV